MIVKKLLTNLDFTFFIKFDFLNSIIAIVLGVSSIGSKFDCFKTYAFVMV